MLGSNPKATAPRILFGVTISYQLRYHDGLYQNLVADGWDVHVASSPGERLARLGDLAGVTIHPVPTEQQPKPRADLSSLRTWHRLIRRVRPRVVVIGTPKAGLLGLMAAFFARVPHRIYELHGLRLETAHGPGRRFLRIMEWVTCHLATQVIAVGPSLRARAIEARVVAPSRIRTLGPGSPNGVDVDHFAHARSEASSVEALRASLGLRPGIPVVAFIGRVTADKGIDILADALCMIRMRLPDLDILIVGGIEDPSGTLGLSHIQASGYHVVYAGQVSDTAPYLAISDVLCLPSLREGLPTIVLEAFAAGVPVVATAATGITDLVSEGRTGFLATVGNAPSLAHALNRALTQPKSADQCAQAARLLVSSHYDGAIVRQRWQTTLAHLLE